MTNEKLAVTIIVSPFGANSPRFACNFNLANAILI
jgi:hypothetical protein